jgi:hypothetical protein
MYNSYLIELENEIQKLQMEEKEMNHSVEAAKRNGEEIEDTIRDWFSRAKSLDKSEKKHLIEFRVVNGLFVLYRKLELVELYVIILLRSLIYVVVVFV